MEEVKITWSIEQPLEMASEAKNTVVEMTDNTDYPLPTVLLADMEAAADLVITKYPTRNGTDLQRGAFKDAVSDLDTKMHTQARYVNEASGGDPLKIAGGGWTATSTSKTKSVITLAVEILKLRPLGGGVFKIITKKPIGCEKLFFVIYTGDVVPLTISGTQFIIPDNVKGIQIVANGKASMRLSGFTDFAKISVIAYSINAAGISPPSQVFTTKIL